MARYFSIHSCNYFTIDYMLHQGRLDGQKRDPVFMVRIKARQPRRLADVVIVVQATQMARTIWTVAVWQQDCRAGYVSSRAQTA